jgi:hypothetical protein
MYVHLRGVAKLRHSLRKNREISRTDLNNKLTPPDALNNFG